MASQFKRKLSQSVGVTPVAVGGYTVPAGSQVTVIGMIVSNIKSVTIKASVLINDGTYSYSIVGGATPSVDIVKGSSAVIIGGDQKVVLEPGDSIVVVCDQADAADVVMSILEITGA